jgi:PhnB protein
MSRVSTYLNFKGTTEEAFGFYSSAFGTDIIPPIVRWGQMPTGPGAAELADDEKNLVSHIDLPILAGHILVGTDVLDSMGQDLQVGNNVTVLLETDTRSETDRIYGALSEGSSAATGLQQFPWAYTGSCTDRFGVRWMFNCFEPVS